MFGRNLWVVTTNVENCLFLKFPGIPSENKQMSPWKIVGLEDKPFLLKWPVFWAHVDFRGGVHPASNEHNRSDLACYGQTEKIFQATHLSCAKFTSRAGALTQAQGASPTVAPATAPSGTTKSIALMPNLSKRHLHRLRPRLHLHISLVADTPDMNVAMQNASDTHLLLLAFCTTPLRRPAFRPFTFLLPVMTVLRTVLAVGLAIGPMQHHLDPTIEVQHQVVLPPLVQFCLVGCWWGTWRVIPEARDGRSCSPPTSN